MSSEIQKYDSLDTLSKKGTCIEFFSAYQDLDLERMLMLCHPEGTVNFEPLGKDGHGKIYQEGQLLWAQLMEWFPDLDNTVYQQQFDLATNTVTCKVALFGKQEKDFHGIVCSDRSFDSDHIFIFRFDDQSKIDQITIQWDYADFVRQ